MRPINAAALGLATIIAAACAENPATPALERAEPFAAATTASSCAANPTHIVSTEAELHAAVASGSPGDVIAVSGHIALQQDVFVERPGVTLTCAAAGDGLSYAPGNPRRFGLVEIFAPDATVTGLNLDARTGGYGIYAIRQSGVRVTHNTIQCGYNGCGFWVGTPGAVVTDNVATTSNSATGLHFQELIDNSVIERNTVIAEAPTGNAVFGGIRPRDGVNVRVNDNVVLGPWSNSVSVVNVSDSEILRNRLEDATQYGVVFNIVGANNVVFSRGNLMRANRITGAAGAGYMLRNACTNELTGNPVLKGSGVAAILDVSTGANFVAGSPGRMIDNGAWDCDGDGQTDPNTVHGSRAQGAVVEAAQGGRQFLGRALMRTLPGTVPLM